MPKQNFLLVSLEESQSKQLAEVLSNDTSRKLIDYLSEHEDATETGLSKTLNIPLPTVHYNLQKLKEAQLVTVEEFHHSKIHTRNKDRAQVNIACYGYFCWYHIHHSLC